MGGDDHPRRLSNNLMEKKRKSVLNGCAVALTLAVGVSTVLRRGIKRLINLQLRRSTPSCRSTGYMARMFRKIFLSFR